VRSADGVREAPEPSRLLLAARHHDERLPLLHRGRMMRKMDAGSVAELVVMAGRLAGEGR
jgi:hypothetical protein